MNLHWTSATFWCNDKFYFDSKLIIFPSWYILLMDILKTYFYSWLRRISFLVILDFVTWFQNSCDVQGFFRTYICHGLSLLEMHSGRNDQRPWCRPTSLGILGARWPNTIYYWGGLRLAVPMGSSPCSISTPTLVGGQCTGAQLTKLLGEKYGYSPWAVLT